MDTSSDSELVQEETILEKTEGWLRVITTLVAALAIIIYVIFAIRYLLTQGIAALQAAEYTIWCSTTLVVSILLRGYLEHRDDERRRRKHQASEGDAQ